MPVVVGIKEALIGIGIGLGIITAGELVMEAQRGRQNIHHTDLQGLTDKELENKKQEALQAKNSREVKRIEQQQKANLTKHSREKKDKKKK